MSPRPTRAHGEGGISRRNDGRWAASIMRSGQRYWAYAHSQREARQKLNQLRLALDRGEPAAPSRLTVGEQLADWLAGRTNIAPNSRRSYETALRLRLVPRFGDRRLGALTAQEIRTAYADWLGAGVGAPSIAIAHAALSQALGQAERDGLVARNVARQVSPPSQARHERPTFTREEARRLLGAVARDRLAALWTLAAFSGMRRGELLGLGWSDVDLEARQLWVRRQLRRGSAGQEVAETKTRSSRRPIDLAAPAADALRRHRLQQAEERLAAGRHWQDAGLVFCDQLGAPYALSSFTRRHWYPLLAAAGLPPLRLHDLRHTVATLLLGAGVHQTIVASLLGHSNTAMTEHYSHVSPSMQREAVVVLERLLSG